MPDLVCKIEAVARRHGLERPRRRGPLPRLSTAEVAAVAIARAWFRVAAWKDLFDNPVLRAGWRRVGGFELGSYGRFMLRLPEAAALLDRARAEWREAFDGFGAIDSTLVAAGSPWLAKSRLTHKALRRQGVDFGHGSTGVCFGLKLTLVANSRGGLVAASVDSASCHDLTPVKRGLLTGCIGVLLADSGHRSRPEARRLQQESLALLARPRASDERCFTRAEACLYRSREVIEGIISKLKRRFGLVPHYPPRRRSSLLLHILAALVAYVLHPNKPRMHWLSTLRSGMRPA